MSISFIAHNIADVLPTKPKNTIAQGGQLNWWRETLGDYSLADITPARIVQCRDQLSKTLSPRGKLRTPATVNRVILYFQGKILRSLLILEFHLKPH